MISILIPVYNERQTLPEIISRVLSVPMPEEFEVIIVDDGSSDGSVEMLKELAGSDPRIKLIFHEINQGKGAAIHTAIKHISGSVAVIQDADLEYDPNDIPRLIAPILDGRADAVFGSRFAGSECRRVLYYWHSVGNQFLTWLTNVLCDINLTDMETCYKAVRSDILKNTILDQRDFGLEPELTIRLAQWGLRIYEVPVSYVGRTYADGKKITWKDGLRAIWVIFKTAILNKRFTANEGYYTLRSIRNAHALNKWMYDRIEPYLGQSVFEAGCGIGNLSHFLKERKKLVCSDIDPFYVETIGRRYQHLRGVKTMVMDLTSSKDYQKVASENIDTIVCMNVLEHLEGDEAVLKAMHETLCDEGKVIILVPQHPWLMTPIDVAVGHFRRYTREELRDKMTKADFEIIHTEEFNRLGTFGWITSGMILRRSQLEPGQMLLFDRLVPIAKLIDKIKMVPAMSLIVVGKKKKRS